VRGDYEAIFTRCPQVILSFGSSTIVVLGEYDEFSEGGDNIIQVQRSVPLTFDILTDYLVSIYL
jgi:hypothetical protein